MKRPTSLRANNKAQTVPLHLRTPKLSREVCKPRFLLLYRWWLVSTARGTNPFWLKDGFQEGCGEGECFYSEPHLPRSPAPGCFPRTCFNFSGMKGGRGRPQRPPFWGAASWHHDSGLSASRRSQGGRGMRVCQSAAGSAVCSVRYA